MFKKFLASLLTALAVFQIAAQTTYTPASVPNVQLSDYRQFVSNPDRILLQSTVDEINRMCLELKEKDIAQVVVLMLDDVSPDNLDLFAHTMLNTWGVGTKGKNNGLVISVVRNQRDIQFETGYGLEGVLPDALCKRIQTTYMVPYLRENNWDEGVLEGVRAVYNVLMGNQEELGALHAAEKEERATGLAILLMFLLPFLIGYLALRRSRRKLNTCPVCHTKGGLKLVKSEVVSRTKTTQTVESTYKCKKCGHIVKRRRTDGTGGGGGGFLIGAGLGSLAGGSRGGGFGGGFGGGMSGGGGARTGF